LGLQSALLSSYYDPIYLSSIVIGDMFDKEALERALYHRMAALKGTITFIIMITLTDYHADLPVPYKLNQPQISSTEIPFEASKTYLKKTAISCGTSISWVVGMPKSEVIVNGMKQGAPKNKPLNEKTRSSLCKKSLYQKCVNALQIEGPKSYYEWKQSSVSYQQAKSCLLDQVFDAWVQTPSDYEQFTL
jgi:tRNA-specific adenosine deaminase 1